MRTLVRLNQPFPVRSSGISTAPLRRTHLATSVQSGLGHAKGEGKPASTDCYLLSNSVNNEVCAYMLDSTGRVAN